MRSMRGTAANRVRFLAGFPAIFRGVARARRGRTHRRYARYLIFVRSWPVLTGCLGTRSDVNPICAEYHDKAHPRGQARAKRRRTLSSGDNNDLSRRDIMLIRAICNSFYASAFTPAPRHFDRRYATATGRDGTGRDRGLPLDFLLTITPVRRLLITNCLLCRSGARALGTDIRWPCP